MTGKLAVEHFDQKANRRLIALTVALIAVCVLAMDFVFISLHAADDEDHFGIAYAASRFELGPVAAPNPHISSGTYVDASIPTVIHRNFEAVRLTAKPRWGKTDWADRQTFMPLPASSYLPIVYIPQAIAIRFGETAGLSVESTINVARIANGLTALLIIAAAVSFMPPTMAIFVLVLLSLPKSLQLFSSNSADPMGDAIAIAILALFYRAETSPEKAGAWHFVVASFGILAIAGVKPPFVVIGLLPAYVALRQRDWTGLGLLTIAVVASVAWWSSVLPMVHDVRCPLDGSFAAKIGGLFDHPAVLARTVSERGAYYWATFIGELGYGDARIGAFHPLPMWVYLASTVVLAIAAAAIGDPDARMTRSAKAVLVITSAAIVAGTFVSMAAGCTPLGSTVIEGVQGRYFVIPLILIAAAAAASLPAWPRVEKAVRLALPVFLLANTASMIAAGLDLYWRR